MSDEPQGSGHGSLLFISFTHDMWSGPENMLTIYANDAHLLEVPSSSDMRSEILDSIIRDLPRHSEWCRLRGIKMNPNKTQSMMLGRSRIFQFQHPDFFIGSIPLIICISFKNFGTVN